ncbi:unnamed protein product [Paramecium pentaurelia]|uniref:Uncharacterized protein n=1 Tax=Paramecium pentaurelia TaxID=43138 RepID=A0A8S1S0D5_9CILI|nr:unnamed protein product [Paramecium pentaurelia]
MKLISLCLISLVISNNIMLQTANHQTFQEVFRQFSKQSDFGNKLFGELSVFIQKGATLQDLNNHVEELRKHLANDQEEDEKYFNEQQQSLESGLEGLVNQVQELKESVDIAAKKISVLNQQQQIIDNLFSQDQDSYQKRLANQNVILETISLLVDRVHALSSEGHSLIEKDNLLEEIKQLGRGKHVEVLAQITAHLDTEQVEKVLNLLENLKNAIFASLEADEAKEQENIRLYNKLTGEITASLSESQRYYQQLEIHFEQKDYELSVGKESIKEVGQKLQDRNDSRQFILDRVQEAQQLLNDNLDRIARWSQE